MILEDKLINAHHKLWLRFVAKKDLNGLVDLHDCTVLTGELFEKYYALKKKVYNPKKRKSK